MDMKQFEVLARYNIWATQKLTEALLNVSESDFSRPCGLFFNSICGTLNHILVGEHYLWYSRFARLPIPDGLKLNSIIETDKKEILNLLNQKSHNWVGFLAHFQDKRFPKQLDYITSAGKPMSLSYVDVLLHVFQHSTHHRGQITAALTIMGYPCPELDLVYMLAEESKMLDSV